MEPFEPHLDPPLDWTTGLTHFKFVHVPWSSAHSMFGFLWVKV